MKKFVVLFLVFFYSHSIFSQESVILNKKSTTNKTATSVQKNEKEVNKQYETFSWSPVAKSSKYLLTIEKLQDDKVTWKPYKSVSTKRTSLEVLMESGNYRVSVSTYNFL